MTDRKANKKRVEYIWNKHLEMVRNLKGGEVTLDDMKSKKFEKSFKDFKQTMSRWYPQQKEDVK